MSRTPADNVGMRLEPCSPTPAQERAALAFSDSSVGGQVRSLPDGTAELRTVESGAFRRYLIDEDRTATLVESRPRSARYGWSIGLMWSALLCAFVVPISLILADNVGLSPRDRPGERKRQGAGRGANPPELTASSGEAQKWAP